MAKSATRGLILYIYTVLGHLFFGSNQHPKWYLQCASAPPSCSEAFLVLQTMLFYGSERHAFAGCFFVQAFGVTVERANWMIRPVLLDHSSPNAF